MTGFGAAFRAEIRDLIRHPLMIFGVAASALLAWLVGSGAADELKKAATGWTVYAESAEAGANVAAIFVLAAAAISVATERTRGTVRWLMPRPVSRIAFILGKSSAHALFALALLVVVVSVSWLTASPYGFGDVAPAASTEDGEEWNFVEEVEPEPEFQAAALGQKRLRASILILPALLAASGIGILISACLRSAAGAVICAGFAYVLALFLPSALGAASETARIVPFRAAGDTLTALSDWGQALSTAQWPNYGADALLGALILGVGFPVLAAFIFRSLDLTD